ncbi:tyrosine recombinase XerD [Arthrobacter sp. Hiyo8]|nr:tyrosine recombinase XerD [Arthrobacter sp. Hiyo8]
MPGISETPSTFRKVSDMPSPRRLLSSSKVYEGRIWDVVSDAFELGEDTGTLVRDYIDHPGAVAVLPMNVDGEILLLKQYRHPVGMDLWEIPAGLLDVAGEDFVVGAARELAEEADLTAATWNVLADFFNSPAPRARRFASIWHADWETFPRRNGTSARMKRPKSNSCGSRLTRRFRRSSRAACITRPPSSGYSRPPPHAPTASGTCGRPTLPGPPTRASADRAQLAETRVRTAIDRAVTDYLQHLGVERGLASNTLSAYRRDLSRYSNFLAASGVDNPGNISRRDVTAFAQALADGSDGAPPSASALRPAPWLPSGAAQVLGPGGTTTADPASDVHPPMPGKRLPKAISVGEVTRILEAAGADTATGLRDRALLEFLYSTGARISEAVGLDVDDVSLEAEADGPAIVRLFGKGSKERLVPLGSYGARAVGSYVVRGRPALAAKGKARRRCS